MDQQRGNTASRRQELLSFYMEHHRMPNITEIMELFGFASRSSAFHAAERFVEEGYANKDRTGKLVPAPGLFAVARVGHIRAGFAAPAEEEVADTISIGEYLIGNPNATYLLTVVGDSMEGAGIREGDMVLFERTHDVRPGQIVVALTEDGYTLKYLRKRGSRFYLEAANDRYPDIYPREGEIIGRVTASFRTYG
jgi:SOS-response transcriptional repressor LexA